MVTATADALRELASRVASQMVADALQAMSAGPVTITVHAQPPRLELPPAKRRGRKPGPKPGRRKAKKGRPRKAAPAAAADQVTRRCRKCLRPGGTLVAGTSRTFKCGSCGHTWDARFPRTTVTSAVGGKTAAPCGRCDHAASAHVGDDGRCLGQNGRCVCTEFVR